MRIESSQGDSGGTVEARPNQYSDVNALHPVALDIVATPPGPEASLLREQVNVERLAMALRVAAELGVNRILNADAPGALGLIASGHTFSDLYQVLHDMGLQNGVRILKIGMPYPLDEEIVYEFAEGLDRIIVVESKEPVMEERIQATLYRRGMSVPVYGKSFPDGQAGFPSIGALVPDLIKAKLGPMLMQAFPQQAASVESELLKQQEIMAREYNPTPLRPPTFCPGCPHRASVTLTYRKKRGDASIIPLAQLEASADAIQQPLQNELLIHGDIGCYTMAALPPFQMLDTVSAMGQGGAVADGLAPFSTNPKVAFVGDGTFIHSGRNSILSSLANGTDITYIILDNDTIAMTGGQATPIHTSPAEQDIEIESILRGYGVKHVTTIEREDAYSDKYERTLDGYLDTPGVKAIIVSKECAITEGRRTRREKTAREAQGIYDKWETHYRIQPDICEMCYDCGKKTACVGLDVKTVAGTVYGDKMQINKSTCYNDGICTSGDCPSFQTLRIKRADPARRREVEMPEGLPEPLERVSAGDGYNIFMPGIGGMGVMTVSALLSYASLFDGKQVTFTNRVGLAQKNGAVDSHIIIREKTEEHAAQISAGKTDLYLALDVLEAARPENLNLIAPDRTRTVVNTAETQTVLTIIGAGKFPHSAGLVNQVEHYSKDITAANVFEICEKLFGNRLPANIFMLGIAYQLGALPLSAKSIEQALELNAKAVKRNKAAFGWGRLWVSDRARVQARLNGEEITTAEQLREYRRHYLSFEPQGAKLVSEYDGLLKDAPDIGEEGNQKLAGWLATLMQWGNAADARTYLDFVKEVAQRDGGDGSLTVAVAHNLPRLMAYKDEFEVARLALSKEEEDRLKVEYGLNEADRVEVTYVLDPPWLKAFRRKAKKMWLRPWMQPRLLFALLKWLKFLRRVMPVSHEVRRLERRLPGWYRELVSGLLDNLNPFNYERAVEIASAANGIVGYDDIKLNNWRMVEAQVNALLDNYKSPQSDENVGMAA